MAAIPNYVYFSPKVKRSKLYADIYDKGIQELMESGKLKIILAKYGISDWK